ncbi:MAG: hypothetical protein AAGD06_03940 [Acidobacteriota bacterium]
MPNIKCASFLFAILVVLELPCGAAGVVIEESDSFDTAQSILSGLLLDDQIRYRNQAVSVPASALPNGADLVAYDSTTTDTFFSVDTTVDLGGLSAGPGDVVRIDPGGVVSLEIDGAALGLAAGAGIDALTSTGDPSLPLAVSFDTTVELPAVGATTLVADDEDLVKTNGTLFEAFFDGSAAGLDPAVDLDGAHLDTAEGELRLSLDISGQVGGVTFNDEDLLGWNLSSGAWRLVRNGSATSTPDPGADLDAYSLRVLPALFADGFESGDTTEWSVEFP